MRRRDRGATAEHGDAHRDKRRSRGSSGAADAGGSGDGAEVDVRAGFKPAVHLWQAGSIEEAIFCVCLAHGLIDPPADVVDATERAPRRPGGVDIAAAATGTSGIGLVDTNARELNRLRWQQLEAAAENCRGRLVALNASSLADGSPPARPGEVARALLALGEDAWAAAGLPLRVRIALRGELRAAAPWPAPPPRSGSSPCSAEAASSPIVGRAVVSGPCPESSIPTTAPDGYRGSARAVGEADAGTGVAARSRRPGLKPPRCAPESRGCAEDGAPSHDKPAAEVWSSTGPIVDLVGGVLFTMVALVAALVYVWIPPEDYAAKLGC